MRVARLATELHRFHSTGLSFAAAGALARGGVRSEAEHNLNRTLAKKAEFSAFIAVSHYLSITYTNQHLLPRRNPILSIRLLSSSWQR